MLILKILDSRSDGEAPTSEIARELALLDSIAREIFMPSAPIEGGIFGAGLVNSPRKGIWRISVEGRQYLRLAASRNGVMAAEAALLPDIAAEAEIPIQKD